MPIKTTPQGVLSQFAETGFSPNCLCGAVLATKPHRCLYTVSELSLRQDNYITHPQKYSGEYY